MYNLIWFAVIATVNGPVTGTVPEGTKFKDMAECVEFAKLMTPRMQDWVRGNIHADWGNNVGIRWRCEKSGEPV